MKITVKAGTPKDNELAAKLTIDKADVDAAIKKAYRDIANRYNFQGFRKGKTPRPVIDSAVGRESVLAQATNEILNVAEPLMLEELDLVPMAEPNYGDEPALVEEGKDYSLDVTIPVRPVAELSSYDAPEIEMPPAEATDAEVERQIEQLQSYRTTYEDLDEDRAVVEGDILSVDVESIEGGQNYVGKNRMLMLDNTGLPEELQKAFIGMKAGESKEASWTDVHEHDGETHEHVNKVKITVNALKKAVVPELTDELVKTGYGFDDVAAFKDAVRQEITAEKANQLPILKEDRVMDAFGANLQLDEVPEAYVTQVFNETVNQFMTNLSMQGLSVDSFLASRGIGIDQFVTDMRAQADERARQSLALDALAAKLGLEATEDDIRAEFERAGASDVDAQMAEFASTGRMPAVREGIRRSKALDWLVENAKVTEVDEIAAADEEKAEKKPAKKAAAKKAAPKKAASKKKAEEKADGAAEEGATEAAE